MGNNSAATASAYMLAQFRYSAKLLIIVKGRHNWKTFKSLMCELEVKRGTLFSKCDPFNLQIYWPRHVLKLKEVV